MFWKRKLVKVGIAIVILASGLAGIFVLLNKSSEKKRVEALKARITTVSFQDLRKELTLAGKILPLSSAAVYSPVSGQLKQLFVKEGEMVKAGQNLFAVLQDSSGQRELEAQQNEVKRTLLELNSAEDAQERRQKVLDLFAEVDNFKAKTDLERKKLDYQTARQRLNLLEETLGIKANGAVALKKDGRNNEIFVRAPRDGVVTFISKFLGESVFGAIETTSSAGREVMTLSETDKMIVRSRVLEADLASVSLNMPVEVRLDAYKNTAYPGNITRISQQGVEDTAAGYTYFIIDVSLQKPDSNVRAQMNATLNFVVGERKHVLALPVNAVATLNGHSVVEVAPAKDSKPGVGKFRNIKIGFVTDRFVEVSDPSFKEGEEVLELDFAALDLKKLAAGTLADEASDSAKSKDDLVKKSIK